MIKPIVYIIESPGPENFLQQKIEGDALTASLTLAEIENRYYCVVNMEMLELCLSRIKEEILSNWTHRKIDQVYLHFSCHGSKHGIWLTDGSLIIWEELGKLLLEFGKASDIFDDERDFGHMILALSSCEGAHAEVLLGKTSHPCTVIVGPTEKVGWADSLVAFATFYHLMIFKEKDGVVAVEGMNIAAGLTDIFQAFVSPKLFGT